VAGLCPTASRKGTYVFQEEQRASHPTTGSHDPSRVRIFDSIDSPADTDTLTSMADGLRDLDLAAPAVVLPDFHHKSRMEMPSSIAVATTETIRPTLTSSSVNCGMALMTLDCDRPSNAAIETFFRKVRERYPFPRRTRPELSPREVLGCAAEGGQFALERFGAVEDDLAGVEEGGRLDIEAYGGVRRLAHEVPWLLRALATMRFGSVGPSNHFVELQQVEELIDPDRAALLGLKPGQLTIQYHAGGGMLASLLGRMFGRRRDYPRPVRTVMAVHKPLAHLTSARSVRQLQLRRQLYFAGACPPVPRNGVEGRRIMLANAAAMNYGWAFRLATYGALRGFAHDAFGARDMRLVVDSPHNSVYEEQVGGVTAVVHRHNSCRAYPAELMRDHPVFSQTGQPLLMPGTNRTSSYLCVAGVAAADSLHSTCHGAGTIIGDFARRGLSQPDPRRRSTLKFSYSDAAPTPVEHLDDRGVDEALGILTRHRLVSPVARMRPVAVLT